MTAARRRLQSPEGELVWRVVTPGGHDSIHPTEQAAINRAALYDNAQIYPLIVEVDEAEEEAS